MLKESPDVEVVNEILKVIEFCVVDMQGISGSEAARDKEDESGMTGDDSGAIHTNDRAVYTKGRAVHEHNEDGLGNTDLFVVAGLVHIENRNGAAAIKGKN